MTQEIYSQLCEILGTPVKTLPVADGVVALWSPIYDRTPEDIVYGNPKASFDFVTLNRICANAEFLAEILHTAGITANYTFRTKVYAREQYITISVFNSIIAIYRTFELAIYRKYLSQYHVAMQLLDYTTINTIERCLYDAQEILRVIEGTFFYSGEVFAGEV